MHITSKLRIAMAVVVLSSCAAATSAFAITDSSGGATPGVGSTTSAAAKVRLLMDQSGLVGETQSGLIQLLDSKGVATSVAGSTVALQEKRGNTWVDISGGDTDANGQYAVSVTLDTNTVLRATLHPATGAAVASSPVNVYAGARVTWSVRPDLTVTHGVRTVYGFRISPTSVASGHVEVANAKKPGAWTKVASSGRKVSGSITQGLTFPKPGTYLVRGASDPTSTNGTGYTTVITVVVS